MPLIEKINSDLKKAQINREEINLSVLRLLIAAIRNKEIEKKTKGLSPLTDEEIISIIFTEAKKRKEAIGQYRIGNRSDLAEKEEKELEILKTYLPEQLTEEEIRQMARSIIKEIGATDARDLGKIMAVFMPKIKGKADGGLVTKIIKEELTS